MKKSVNAVVLLVVVLLAGAGVGCARSPSHATRVVHAPLPYVRRFPVPKERAFQATRTALAVFGYTVAYADPERGTIKTAPKMHRLARLSSSSSGDLTPQSHAFVISVRDEGDNSVVAGYLRTFSAEHETTTGSANAPVVQEMWSRLFAEIAANGGGPTTNGRGAP